MLRDKYFYYSTYKSVLVTKINCAFKNPVQSFESFFSISFSSQFLYKICSLNEGKKHKTLCSTMVMKYYTNDIQTCLQQRGKKINVMKSLLKCERGVHYIKIHKFLAKYGILQKVLERRRRKMTMATNRPGVVKLVSRQNSKTNMLSLKLDEKICIFQ